MYSPEIIIRINDAEVTRLALIHSENDRIKAWLDHERAKKSAKP